MSTILTVTQINTYIKSIIEQDINLKNIYVSGEISNFTNHYRSGHLYFTLKDQSSEIRAVMFRASAIKVRFKIENGQRVIVRARVGVYEQAGTYQLYVSTITPEGIGDLHLAYEQLKAKLYEKGLFDEDKKKEIPKFPKRIGIITSPTGAAVRDIINVATRRCPLCELILFPSLVQGEDAPLDLISGIDYFNIGTGVGYSVLDIVHAYEKATGIKINYKIAPRRPGDIDECYANPKKAYEVLGWSAQYNIEDMCRDSYNWQRRNPNGYDN